MRVSEIDWSVLRGALALLLVAILVAGAMVGGAYRYGERHDRQWADAKRRLDSVRGRYRTIDEEARLIERYLPEYQRLQQQGLLGEERRLDWIEALRASAADVRLTSLRYEVTSQQPYQPDFDLPLGRFSSRESRMNLDIGLLHEGDLPRLFAALDAHRHGLFQVQECRVTRNGTEFVFEPERANLSARCRLRWLTLASPGARD